MICMYCAMCCEKKGGIFSIQKMKPNLRYDSNNNQHTHETLPPKSFSNPLFEYILI